MKRGIMRIPNTKKFSKVCIIVLFSALIILLIGVHVNAVPGEGEPECVTAEDCGGDGWRCTPLGVCRFVGICGDASCNGIETPSSCPQDCKYCDDTCQPTGCIQWDYGIKSGYGCKPSCGKAGGIYCAANIYECPAGATSYNFLTWDCTVCCISPSLNTCGNGQINSGEDCDGSNLNGKTCQSQGFTGGTLKCYPPTDSANKCKFDSSGCTGGGGLTAAPPSISVAKGATTPPITISGGTPPYKIKPNDPPYRATTNPGNDIALPSNSFTITGTVEGATSIVIYDSGSSQKTVTIPVTVTAAGGTGTLCTPLAQIPPINYGPYTTFNTEKERAWRISMCFQPPQKSNAAAFKATMDNWVAEYNKAFSPAVQRKPGGSETTDAVLFSGGLVDVIESAGTSNPKWAFFPISGSSGECGQGPFFDKLEGYDYTKFMDCSHKTPKYLAGRVFSNFAEVRLSGEVISMLGEVGLNPTKLSENRINFDIENEPGKKVGIVDVIRDGVAWRWIPVEGPITPEGPPQIDSINPTSAKAGATILTITGKRLTQTVQFFDSSRKRDTFVGNINADATQASILVPSTLKPGQYAVRIYAAADRFSNEVSITILGGVLKYTPDEDASGYCAEDSQCLIDPLASIDNQCISSSKFSGDNYCDGGQWSTRTKLLALKLLKMRGSDYILFCDDKDNALNNLQYLTDSNEIASSSLINLGANNFCILKIGDGLIASTSLNKELSSAPNSLNVFGVSSCSSGMITDGNYHPCDGSNKVWYNKNLNSMIFSSASISVPSSQESPGFIYNLIKPVIDSLKRLLIKPPYDESYLNGIKKFRRLYMSVQGGKSIMGSIDGKDYQNAVLQYAGFNGNICDFVNEYGKTKIDSSSGIACRSEGSTYYVLAQGSQLTVLNPNSIWVDLTSKLRAQ